MPAPRLFSACLASLCLSVATAGPLPTYSLRLGLSDREWNGILNNTNGQVAGGYQITQQLQTVTGTTLVAWASTPALDPRGPHGFGVQVYGSSDQFVRWLPAAKGIDRAFVLCGRYLVGGGNTLRVWDTESAGALLAQRPVPTLSRNARIRCQNGLVSADGWTLRLRLPSLTPFR